MSWDEELHRRMPSGSPEGGQFIRMVGGFSLYHQSHSDIGIEQHTTIAVHDSSGKKVGEIHHYNNRNLGQHTAVKVADHKGGFVSPDNPGGLPGMGRRFATTEDAVSFIDDARIPRTKQQDYRRQVAATAEMLQGENLDQERGQGRPGSLYDPKLTQLLTALNEAEANEDGRSADVIAEQLHTHLEQSRFGKDLYTEWEMPRRPGRKKAK